MWKFLQDSFGKKRVWLWLTVIILGIILLLAPSPFAQALSEFTKPSPPRGRGAAVGDVRSLTDAVRGIDLTSDASIVFRLVDESASPVTFILLVLVTVLLLGFLVWRTIAVHKVKAKEPLDKLIDEIGRVVTPISPNTPGKVRIYGEIWDAVSEETLPEDTEIRVVGFHPSDRTKVQVTRYKEET